MEPVTCDILKDTEEHIRSIQSQFYKAGHEEGKGILISRDEEKITFSLSDRVEPGHAIVVDSRY